MADNRIHFQPFNDNHNVKCLNGSYHRKSTTDAKEVTCEACSKNDTDPYWIHYEEREGNVNKNSYKGLRPFLQSTFKLFAKKTK